MKIRVRLLCRNLTCSLITVILVFGLSEGLLGAYARWFGRAGYYRIAIPPGMAFGQVLYPKVTAHGYQQGLSADTAVGQPDAPYIALAGEPARASLVLLGESTSEAFPLPLLEPSALRRCGLNTAYNFGREASTSDYGLEILDRVLARAPALVFVSFVWNDHWLARGTVPAAAAAGAAAPVRELLARYSRLFNLMEYLHYLHFYDTTRLNVPEPRYAANYDRMLAGCRAAGAKVVVWTAPTNLSALDLLPEEYRNAGNLSRSASAAGIHRRYNDLARAAATRGGATVLDVAALFAAETPARQNEILYDTIHFTPAGYEWLAAHFSRQLAAGIRP